jgi:hypothetical protein
MRFIEDISPEANIRKPGSLLVNLIKASEVESILSQ